MIMLTAELSLKLYSFSPLYTENMLDNQADENKPSTVELLKLDMPVSCTAINWGFSNGIVWYFTFYLVRSHRCKGNIWNRLIRLIKYLHSYKEGLISEQPSKSLPWIRSAWDNPISKIISYLGGGTYFKCNQSQALSSVKIRKSI